MKILLTALLLTTIGSCTIATKKITQFTENVNTGIVVTNTTKKKKTIYARFLIPGLRNADLRNSGTMQKLKPQQTVIIYLPTDTKIVATDGIYWDNPDPNYPKERHIATVKKNLLLELTASDFLF